MGTTTWTSKLNLIWLVVAVAGLGGGEIGRRGKGSWNTVANAETRTATMNVAFCVPRT